MVTSYKLPNVFLKFADWRNFQSKPKTWIIAQFRHNSIFVFSVTLCGVVNVWMLQRLSPVVWRTSSAGLCETGPKSGSVGHIRWRIATVSNNVMKSVQRALPHVYLRTRMFISRLWCDPSHAPSGTFRELACVGPHCTCSKRLRHFLLCQMFHVCLIREMPANPRNRNTSTRWVI